MFFIQVAGIHSFILPFILSSSSFINLIFFHVIHLFIIYIIHSPDYLIHPLHSFITYAINKLLIDKIIDLIFGHWFILKLICKLINHLLILIIFSQLFWFREWVDNWFTIGWFNDWSIVRIDLLVDLWRFDSIVGRLIVWHL